MEKYEEGDELAKVLAVLLYVQGEYTYIDKISQSASKDLTLYYTREALRDFNSLRASKKITDDIYLAYSINFDKVENELKSIRSMDSVPHLRETVSYISSMALSIAANMRSRKEYNIALKIMNYFKSKNIIVKDADEFSKKILDSKEDISSNLNVDVDDIESMAKNKSLLSKLLNERSED
jgi:hypothetical protein